MDTRTAEQLRRDIARLERRLQRLETLDRPALDASDYLPLSGGTMTGDLVLAGDPDAALEAATKQYVDALETSLGVVTGYAFSDTNRSKEGAVGAWTEDTDSRCTFTLAATSTVLVFGLYRYSIGNAANSWLNLRFKRDDGSTSDAASELIAHNNSGYVMQAQMFGRFTGVKPGSRWVQFQQSRGYNTHSIEIRATWIAIVAVPE